MLLDGGQRADRLDDLTQLADLRVGELGADRGPQQLRGFGIRLVGELDGLGEQHRSLTPAEVVTRRFAGHRGIAEHAEHVVAQLEGHPEIVADLVEDRLHVGPVGGGGHPELKRPGDGVRGGLVGVDGHRRRHRRRTAGLGDDVEILAAEHLGANVGPHPLNPALRVRAQLGRRHDVVGPHQGEIPEQDRRRQPELLGGSAPAAVAVLLGEEPVHRGQPPPGCRIVDHVVVHQRTRVEQFQRREQPQHGGVCVAVGDGAPAPVGERGPQPLAPAQHELLERRGELGVVGADVGAEAAALFEIRPQLVGHGAGQLDG